MERLESQMIESFGSKKKTESPKQDSQNRLKSPYA